MIQLSNLGIPILHVFFTALRVRRWNSISGTSATTGTLLTQENVGMQPYCEGMDDQPRASSSVPDQSFFSLMDAPVFSNVRTQRRMYIWTVLGTLLFCTACNDSRVLLQEFLRVKSESLENVASSANCLNENGDLASQCEEIQCICVTKISEYGISYMQLQNASVR